MQAQPEQGWEEQELAGEISMVETQLNWKPFPRPTQMQTKTH